MLAFQLNSIFGHAQLVEARNYDLDVQTRQSLRPQVYSIEETVPPVMQPRSAKGERAALERIARAQFVLIGDHLEQLGAGEEDAVLERKLVLALVKEARRQRRDSVLVYASSPERQAWLTSLDADNAGGRLRSVAVDSVTEIERKVLASGLESLSASEKLQAVQDAESFVSFVKLPGFRVYSDEVLSAAYEEQLAGDRSGPSLEGFVS
eukprot:gene42317-51680_t